MLSIFENVVIRGLSKVPCNRTDVIYSVIHDEDFIFYSSFYFPRITLCEVYVDNNNCIYCHLRFICFSSGNKYGTLMKSKVDLYVNVSKYL